MRTAGGDVFSAPALLGLADLFAADAALGDAFEGGVASWRQAGAVALSTCHLISIDCGELCQALRQQHPALLKHLAEKVLRELGAASLEQQQQKQQQEGSAASPAAPQQQQQEQQEASGASSPSSQQQEKEEQQEHAAGAAAPGANGAAGADAPGKPARGSASDEGSGVAAAVEALRQLIADLDVPAAAVVAGAKPSARSKAPSFVASSPSTWDELLVDEDELELEGVEVAPPPPLAFVWHTD